MCKEAPATCYCLHLSEGPEWSISVEPLEAGLCPMKQPSQPWAGFLLATYHRELEWVYPGTEFLVYIVLVLGIGLSSIGA